MTDYFHTRKNAAEYILMTDGYDGREIVKQLERHLAPRARVLELGMGPGRDIPLLEENYRVTGSDNSQAFLDMYLERKPGADLLLLDAATLKTKRKFDCIYSNKVLHHLTKASLKQSFKEQARLLNKGGLLCHTLWYGDKEIEVKGMKFMYYTEQTILDYLGNDFSVLVAQTYREMDFDDSMLLIAKKN